jgi:hypothetical protein
MYITQHILLNIHNIMATIWDQFPFEKPTIREIYDNGRELYAYYSGRLTRLFIDKPHEEKRDTIEKIIYDTIHGDVSTTYDCISLYLDENILISNLIIDAFKQNLYAQGRPQTEVDINVGEIGMPWKVFFIYSLLTSDYPDYTEIPSVSETDIRKYIN